MSIEVWLMENFLMNLLVIVACSGARRFCPGRAAMAALLGAAYSAAVQGVGLTSFFWAFLPIPGIVWVSGLARTARALPEACGRLALGVVFMAGMQIAASRVFENQVLSECVGAVLGCGALRSVLIGREKRRDTWEIGLRVEWQGRQARFPALIDTGNRLREPSSGLPVIIVEAGFVRRLLPETYLIDAEAGRLPPGFRRVGYGALGGNGSMGCFLPDRIVFSDGQDAPDAWVAVYPGRIPGSVRALAPAAYARTARRRNGGMAWRERRDSHYSALS